MENQLQEYIRVYKRKVLEELLEIINEICLKHQLLYFAMTNLLGCVIEKRDPEIEDNKFCIGMMREDYDIFFDKLASIANEKKIDVVSFYDENFNIKKIHSRICIKRTFEGESGEKSEIALELRVEPFELLPDDPDRKNDFLKEVARQTKEYRLESKKQLSCKGKKPKKGFLKKYHFYREQKKIQKKFEEGNKEYRRFLHQYSQSENCSSVARIELLTYAEHKLDTIFPIEQIAYGKMKVMVPADVEEFIMYSSQKEAQRRIAEKLDLLRRFDNMCTKEEIPYFLMQKSASLGVTLDADSLELDRIPFKVGMIRSDYNRAINLLKKQVDEKIFLDQTIEDYLFIKDYRTKISLGQRGKRYPGCKEPYIYLYPFDKVPKEKVLYRKMQDEIIDLYDMFDESILREKGLSDSKESSLMTSWECYEKIEEIKQSYNNSEEDSYYIFTFDKKRCINVAMNQVYPVARRFYGKGSASYPAKEFLWCNKANQTYRLYGQERLLELLRSVVNICTENEIKYFALKELLIGAVIYEDFIPESAVEPLSIGFERNQYEAFLSYIRKNASMHRLKLCEYYEEGNTVPLPIKCIILQGDFYPTNIRIDLYPFDRIPEDFYCQKGFLEDIAKNNSDYRNLVRYHMALKQNYIHDYTKEDYETMKSIWQSQDVIEEYHRVDSFAQSFQHSENVPYLGCVAFKRIKMIHEKDLYGLEMHRFHDLMIACPKDYSVWQPMMDEELKRQSSCLQKACLIILEEFSRVCKEIGVGYFICGGTLLGYMRDGGYIPWDDDIDIGMLREDYDLFLEKANNLLKDNYFLQTRESDPNNPFLYTKIRMKGTQRWNEFGLGRDYHCGISIDIFPFDYLPEDLDVRNRQVEEAAALNKKHVERARAQYPEPKVIHEPQNSLEQRYHEEQKKRRAEAWTKSLVETQNEYLKVATQYNLHAKENGLKTVGSFIVSYTYIDLEDLLPYKEGVFEGVNVLLPKRPEVFLHMQYGDYMKLPPMHKRIAHRLLYWATYDESGGRLKSQVENGSF